MREGRRAASRRAKRPAAKRGGGVSLDSLVSYLSVVRGRSQELSAHPVDLPVVLGDAHFADGPILHPRSAGRGVGGERRARGGRAGGAPAHTRERASRLPKHTGSFTVRAACVKSRALPDILFCTAERTGTAAASGPGPRPQGQQAGFAQTSIFFDFLGRADKPRLLSREATAPLFACAQAEARARGGRPRRSRWGGDTSGADMARRNPSARTATLARTAR